MKSPSIPQNTNTHTFKGRLSTHEGENAADQVPNKKKNKRKLKGVQKDLNFIQKVAHTEGAEASYSEPEEANEDDSFTQESSPSLKKLKTLKNDILNTDMDPRTLLSNSKEQLTNATKAVRTKMKDNPKVTAAALTVAGLGLAAAAGVMFKKAGNVNKKTRLSAASLATTEAAENLGKAIRKSAKATTRAVKKTLSKNFSSAKKAVKGTSAAKSTKTSKAKAAPASKTKKTKKNKKK